MTFWISAAASYVGCLALFLAFNRGAHRKPSLRREPAKSEPVHPTRGNISYQPSWNTTETSGVLVAEDTADTGWR